jgi:hypothetical protein
MYLVIDEPSQTGAVVDPFDAKKLTAAAKEHGAKVANHDPPELTPAHDAHHDAPPRRPLGGQREVRECLS